MTRSTVLLMVAALMLAGCKFVPTAGKSGKQTGDASDQFPEQKAAALWDSKVLPYLAGKAGDLKAVVAEVAQNADGAGAKYGHKEKQGSSPWTVAVSFAGKIIAANTESRASTIDIDVDGDGTADGRVQIGPVIRGTAIRDSLDFVSFNQFTNQIDFAQFGKGFNIHLDKTVTSLLPRDGLVGKTADGLGVFPLVGGPDLPLITPVKLVLQ